MKSAVVRPHNDGAAEPAGCFRAIETPALKIAEVVIKPAVGGVQNGAFAVTFIGRLDVADPAIQGPQVEINETLMAKRFQRQLIRLPGRLIMAQTLQQVAVL